MNEKNYLYQIVSLSRQIRSLVKQKTASLPLTFEQIRAISYIYRFRGINLIQLAEYLEIKPMTATKIVSALSNDNWLIKQTNPSDKRAYQLFLTDKGNAICVMMEKVAKEIFITITDNIPEASISSFEIILNQMKENIEKAKIK